MRSLFWQRNFKCRQLPISLQHSFDAHINQTKIGKIVKKNDKNSVTSKKHIFFQFYFFFWVLRTFFVFAVTNDFRFILFNYDYILLWLETMKLFMFRNFRFRYISYRLITSQILVILYILVFLVVLTSKRAEKIIK